MNLGFQIETFPDWEYLVISLWKKKCADLRIKTSSPALFCFFVERELVKWLWTWNQIFRSRVLLQESTTSRLCDDSLPPTPVPHCISWSLLPMVCKSLSHYQHESSAASIVLLFLVVIVGFETFETTAPRSWRSRSRGGGRGGRETSHVSPPVCCDQRLDSSSIHSHHYSHHHTAV